MTKHRKCQICGEDIVLVPSAEARAKRYGGKAEDYRLMFSVHPQCIIDRREAETLALIRRKDRVNS